MKDFFARKKLLALIAIIILTGVFLGKSSYCITGKDDSSGLYKNLKILAEAIHYVETSYVKPISGKDLIYGAIKGMMSTLDPHSVFMPPDMLKELEVETKGEFGGVGMEITSKDDYIYVVSPIEDTPAWKAGIKAGDRIIKIDGVSTKGMSVMDAVKKLRGPKGTKVTITIMRSGVDKPFDVTIVRDIIKIKSVKYEMKEDGIAYIKVRNFQETTADELDKALSDLSSKAKIKGIILDLRNNPGGLLSQAVSVSERFLPKGSLIVYTKGRDERDTMRFVAKSDKFYDYPMVVLVNAGSASASEIVTGALKANRRAIVVGERTFGKGSVQSILPLSDGSAIKLTTAYYYTPDGTCIEEKGIIPDVEIPDNLVAKEGHAIREEELKKLKEGNVEEVEKKIKESSKLDTKEDYQLKVAISILRVLVNKELVDRK
ncbi:MAG: S41 family peptidase [Thermosulfidibacteraceae bacterium]